MKKGSEKVSAPSLQGTYLSFWRFFCGGDPMPEDCVKRKLSAILSADVEGYSRLMCEDEVNFYGGPH